VHHLAEGPIPVGGFAVVSAERIGMPVKNLSKNGVLTIKAVPQGKRVIKKRPLLVFGPAVIHGNHTSLIEVEIRGDFGLKQGNPYFPSQFH